MSSGEKMQVTRPKSSKGRSRPMIAHFQRVDTPVWHPTLSPHPPSKSNDGLNLQPQTVLRRRSQACAGALGEIFDRAPDESASLNRYRVLPSIQKSTGNVHGAGVEQKASRLGQGGNSRRICNHQCVSDVHTKDQGKAGMRNVLNSPKTPMRSVVMSQRTGSKTSEDEPDLLLAIRNPCGQRFKCHFHPSDKLQVVLSYAEAEFGEKYENYIIETMDVPRRTFTNLTMTIAQCGILNKSVLCISQDDSNMDMK